MQDTTPALAAVKGEEGQIKSPGQGDGQGKNYKLPSRQRMAKFPAAVQERIEKLKARIELDAYDSDAWESLVSELKSRQQNAEVVGILRQVYEDMLEVFPTSCTTWRGYVELEMNKGQPQNVNAIFADCLLKVKSLDLWRVYVKHVKHVNQGSTPEGLNAIKQAYEFTLDHLGTDMSSGPLWMEYIHYLQQANAKILFGQTAPGNEESAKLVTIRRAFQRAVTIPTHSLETLWRDYEKFENGVNRQLGKQILNDLQGQYASSRTVYREIKKKWEGIKLDTKASPPNMMAKEYEQQAKWSKLIAFEKSNPLKLEKDPLAVRIELVYNQCLLCLYHYPEIWYEYAMWHAENDKPSNASDVFKEACAALPACTILFFAAADFEAARENVDEAKGIYEKLLLRASDLELHTQGQIWIQYMRFLRRTEGASSSRKLFLRARKSEGCTHHIYSTSALLEWQNGKDMKVAKNIFELGLKAFLKETEYVMEYANFLISQGDISNARTLYERALTVVQGFDAKVIWNEYLKFEYQCGDLQSTLALETRRKKALVDMEDLDSQELLNHPKFSIGLLLLRYNIKNMLPCSKATLRHLQTIDVDEAFYDLPTFDSHLLEEGDNAPKQKAPSAAGKRKGGQSSSSLPPAIADILSKLPLRHQLTGSLPSVDDVDMVLQTLVNIDVTSLKASQEGSSGVERKRKMEDRKPAKESMNMPPKYDVYRMRQRQRTMR